MASNDEIGAALTLVVAGLGARAGLTRRLSSRRQPSTGANFCGKLAAGCMVGSGQDGPTLESQELEKLTTTSIEDSDSLILYIDLLGTSEYVQSPAGLRPANLPLVPMLRAVAKSAANFAIVTTSEGSGASSDGFTFLPVVSAFSDHAVFSFPLARVQNEWSRKSGPRPFSIHSLLLGFQLRAAALAHAAFDLNLLIRGGITVGPLYHQDRVVVGKALVDAWKLESGVANYPRIVASKQALELPDSDRFWVRDFDGVHHFDYMHLMPNVSLDGAGSATELPEVFVARAIATADKQIAKFNEADQTQRAAKWTWFRNTFEARHSRPETHPSR